MTSAQERTKQLLGTGIPASLRELGENSRKLHEIAKYWEDRFKENPTPEVVQQTQAYTAHSLQSISDHIFSLAGQFNEFLAAQSEQVESFELEMQSVQTRIISNRQLAGARMLKSFRDETGFIDIGNELVGSGARVLQPPSFQLYNEGILNFDAFNDIGVSLSDTTQIRLRSESVAQTSWKVPLGNLHGSANSPQSLRRASAAPGYEENIYLSSLSRKSSMVSVYEDQTSPLSNSRRPSMNPAYENPSSPLSNSRRPSMAPLQEDPSDSSSFARRPSYVAGVTNDPTHASASYTPNYGAASYSSYQPAISTQSSFSPPPMISSGSSGQLYTQPISSASTYPQSPPPPPMLGGSQYTQQAPQPSSPNFSAPPPMISSGSSGQLYAQPISSASAYPQSPPPPPMLGGSQYTQQAPQPSSPNFSAPPPPMMAPYPSNLQYGQQTTQSPPPPPMLGEASSGVYQPYQNHGNS